MTMNPGAPVFDTAMRGYERTAVDAKISALTAERSSFERRAAELERELVAMRNSMSKGEAAPAYVTVSRKLESILRAAHDEARQIAENAAAAGDRDREMANSEAEAMRARMNAEAERAEAAAKETGERMLEAARRESEIIRAEGTDKAARLAATAGEVVEKARAEGAQFATDTEHKMNAQREQFERDVIVRQETAERRLSETATLAQQMKAEAIQMTEDSQRAAQALVDAAKNAAVELVNETAQRAERLQQEAEREVAALTHRRDSINAQLATVKETLASLSGAAALAGVTKANGN